jgi:hypothetical protein
MNWRCSESESESESELLYDGWFTANQLILAPGPLRLTTSDFFLQLNSCCHSPYLTLLWLEDGSVAYNCCWCSPAQSFSCPRPAGPMTVFHCLRFETPPTWRVRSPYLYPPGTSWSSYTLRHFVPFSSPPTTRRVTVEVSEPPSTRSWTTKHCSFVAVPLLLSCLLLRNIFTQPLPRNGPGVFACVAVVA